MTLTGTQEFRIGEVISQSVKTTIRNIIPFGIFAIVAFIIIVVVGWILALVFGFSMAGMMPGAMDTSMGVPAFGAGFFIGMLLFALVMIALYMSVVAAIVYGTIQDLRGQPVGVGALLTSAANFVVQNLPTVAVIVGVWLAAEIVGFLLNKIPIIGPIASLVMFAFLYVALWVVIPVAAIENPGPIATLQRSLALTEGHRLKILGIGLIVLLAAVAALLVIMVLVFVMPTPAMILLGLFYAGLAIFSAVLIAVGYYRLRVVKEGADIGDIAKVFD